MFWNSKKYNFIQNKIYSFDKSEKPTFYVWHLNLILEQFKKHNTQIWRVFQKFAKFRCEKHRPPPYNFSWDDFSWKCPKKKKKEDITKKTWENLWLILHIGYNNQKCINELYTGVGADANNFRRRNRSVFFVAKSKVPSISIWFQPTQSISKF